MAADDTFDAVAHRGLSQGKNLLPCALMIWPKYFQNVRAPMKLNLNKRKALLLGALVLMCAIAIFRLGGSIYSFHEFQRAHFDQGSSPSRVSPTNDHATAIRFVKDPEAAPPFFLHDIAGRNVSLADWKGKVVILNFWATWCPSCREQIPALIELQAKYQSQLQIIGLSEDEDGPKEVAKFAQKAGTNYLMVMATKELVAEYGGVPALPTSFVINPQGRVVQRHTGLYDYQDYEREVRALAGLPVDMRIEQFLDGGEVFPKNAEKTAGLPDVDFSGLTEKQKQEAHHLLNAESCTCGCKLALAPCRINDTSCATSKTLAAEVVNRVRSGSSKSVGSQLPR
jgi:thiol-disulfide isomerase/thioredoxin